MGQIKNIKLHIVTDIKGSSIQHPQYQVKQSTHIQNTRRKARLLTHEESWNHAQVRRLQRKTPGCQVCASEEACDIVAYKEECVAGVWWFAMCCVRQVTHRKSVPY